MTKKIALFALASMTLTAGTSSPARAGYSVSVANGDFNFNAATDGGYKGGPSQLLTQGNTNATNYTSLSGWTVTSGTYGFLMAAGAADTTGSYSPQFSNYMKIWGSNDGGVNTLPTTSPTGGTYLVLDGAAGYHGGGIEQVITGLVIGQAYAVNFYWGSGQQYGFDGTTTESLQVTFGNQVQSTATVTNASHGFTPWAAQTMVFTASSTSQTLNFLANGMPSGLPPMVLLDGVSVSAVPEPASLALTGLGILATGVFHRCRRKPAPSPSA